jgi:uncharacterized membrane protein HdeD (DUF308 family)
MVTEANISRMETAHIHWWLIMLEGLAAFIVGILILAAPETSALALTTLLGAYWFVSGIFSLVSIFTNRTSWGWKLLSGILGVGAGLIVLQYPMFSAILVPAVIGIWLGIDGILIGVMRLVMSYRGAGWGMAILGVVSVLLGFVLLLFPPLAILTDLRICLPVPGGWYHGVFHWVEPAEGRRGQPGYHPYAFSAGTHPGDRGLYGRDP